MKKRIYVFMSLLLLLSLSACGNAAENAGTQANIQEEVQAELPAEAETAKSETEQTETEASTEAEAEQTEAEAPAQEQQDIPPMDLSSLNLQYGQQEEFRTLYEQVQPVENAENFEGTWYRTEVASSLGAEITITEQNEEGFAFIGDFYYYSHMGWIEGTAHFVAPNVAVFEYTHDLEGEIFGEAEDTTPEYLVFEKTQGGMRVFASAASADLGLGMNVFADGDYITGEPVYTNATVLDDNFTAEVQETIQSLLGDDYDTYFKTVVEIGVITSASAILEDGTKAMFYDAFVPTMGGYAFTLLVCENGDLYFNSEADEIGWKTNVEGAIDYPVYTLQE